MKVYIFSTGSEITNGRSVDTNSIWIANELSGLGFVVEKIIVLPDKPELIREEIARLIGKDEKKIILMSGGLGATEDDYTLQVACEVLQTESVEYPPALERLAEIAKMRGMEFAKILPFTQRQARYPKNATVLHNHIGIAPGFYAQLSENSGFAAFPGVPSEMKKMFTDEFLPLFLQDKQRSDYTTLIRYIWVIGEAIFQQRFIQEYRELTDKTEWGVTAKPGYIKVTFRSDDADVLQEIDRKLQASFHSVVADDVLAVFPQILQEKQLSIATAESCTGGLIAKLFTDIPGSSAYFYGSVVSYHNDIKQHALGVKQDTLEKYGAVSEETAGEMVTGLVDSFSVDYGISVTGIAGPGGATETKKVGLVYIGVQAKGKPAIVKKFNLPLRRELFRDYVAHLAIFLLYQKILEDTEQA
ncbi:MAG: nicotinamide-nucleotide amidohydrolase family protein [Spirochaetota bacterium]